MRIILYTTLVLVSTSASASVRDYAFSRIPARFHSLELTTGTRSLGETCLSRSKMPDGTVCNPAYLAEVENSSLIGHVFIGNGYSALSTADQFIFKPVSKEFLQDLFKNQKDMSVEAQAGITFTTRYFSADFSPYRVQYISEVHNPNFPVIAVHAAVERKLTFSGGIPLSLIDESLEPFSFGVRSRIFERNYVHSSFSLFDALTEEPRNLLPPQRQTGIMFEPALAWTDKTAFLRPRASIVASSLGWVWPNDPLHPEDPDFGFGVGIAPRVGPGTWSTGLDLVHLIHGEDLAARTRLGSSYALGISEFMLGLTGYSASTGLQFAFQIAQVGIVYEYTYRQLGDISSGSRVATELAIRL